MTLNDLKAICQAQIDLGGSSNPQVALVQRGRWGKTNRRYLLKVKGEIVQDDFGRGMVVMYPAKELLSAVMKALGVKEE